jgi:hypothetical protein
MHLSLNWLALCSLPLLVAMAPVDEQLSSSRPGVIDVRQDDGTLEWQLAFDPDVTPHWEPLAQGGVRIGGQDFDRTGQPLPSTPTPQGGGAQAAVAGVPGCFFLDTPAVVLPDTGFLTALFAEPLIDLHGNAAVLSRGPGNTVHVTRSVGHSNTWSAPQVATTGPASNPDWAIDSHGRITMVYREIVSSTYLLWSVRDTTGTGTWSQPELIYSSSVFFQSYDLATDEDDNVVVAVQVGTPAAVSVTLFREHATGLWSNGVQISEAGVGVAGTQVVSNADGSALYVLYADLTVPTDGLWSHRWKPATKDFESGQLAPGSSDVFLGLLTGPREEIGAAVDTKGNLSVLWERNNQNMFSIHASRLQSGAWQPAVEVGVVLPSFSEITTLPQTIDVAPNGDVMGWVTRPVGGFAAQELQALRFKADQWTSTKLADVSLPPFTAIPRQRGRFYQDSRALCVLTANSQFELRHYNGADWSEDLISVPAPLAANINQLAADNGELLFLGGNSAVPLAIDGAWTRGTTGFANLGFDLAGTHGPPLLEGSCDMLAGQPVTFTASNTLENTIAWFVLGIERVDTPFFGGTLVPNTTFVFGNQPTGPTGTASLLLTVPDNLESGVALYEQVWVLDAAATQGLSASNALSSTIR